MKISRIPSSPRRVAIILVIAVSIGLIASFFESFDEPAYPSTIAVRYGFTVQNPTSSSLKDAGFWVFAPYGQTSTQKRLGLKASSQYEITQDEFGNERLNFSFDLPPHGSKEIWIESTLAITDVPNRFPDDAEIMTAGLMTFTESSAPEIVQQAENLRQDNVESSLRSIYDWVRQHITYSGYIKDDRGALYALKTGEGDCTEYAYLTAALGQAQQMPARVMAGFVVQRDNILSPADYHNWAEFRWDNAWRLVDPQKEAFLNEPSRYIAMRIVGDLGIDKTDNTQRFFESFGGAQVVMRTPRHPAT